MIKNFFKSYSYGLFLSVALSAFANVSVYDWQWYAIFIPTVILVNMRN